MRMSLRVFILILGFMSMMALGKNHKIQHKFTDIHDENHHGLAPSVPSKGEDLQKISSGETQKDFSTAISRTTTGNNSSPIDDIILGCFFIAGSVLLLWNNERRFVKTRQRLHTSKENCQQADGEFVNNELNGKLVHVKGITSNDQPIVDPRTQLRVDKSIRLKRVAEMYQIFEKKTTSGSGNNRTTTYTYEKIWSSSFIDSSTFVRQTSETNDSSNFVIQSEDFYGQNVKLGTAFVLSTEQKKKVNKFKDIPIDDKFAQQVTQNQQNYLKHTQVFKDVNHIIFRKQPNVLSLGDVRISYKYVPCGDCTVVAEQNQNSFIPWDIHKVMEISSISRHERFSQGDFEAGCCGCGALSACCEEINAPIHQIDLLFEEKLSLDQAFKKEVKSNETRTSVMRVIGWLLSWFGFYLIFSPIYSLLGWFPLIGGLLGQIGRLLAGIASLILGSLVSVLTISTAWLRFRPFIGVPIFLGAIGGLVYIISSYETKQV